MRGGLVGDYRGWLVVTRLSCFYIGRGREITLQLMKGKSHCVDYTPSDIALSSIDR